MKIGKIPLKEKQARLELGPKIITNKCDFKELDQKIISLLSKKDMDLSELSKSLLVNGKTIRQHIDKLIKTKICIIKDYGKWNSFIYGLV